MSPKVGIPRALLYYYYYPQWESFFQSLGCEVVVSDKSNKAILNAGVKSSVDEACLPIKLAYGHILNLKKKRVDFLFVPRLVSLAPHEYTCPKFLGFPDMVKQNIKDLPPLIDVTINNSLRNEREKKALLQVGKIFTRNPLKIWQAYIQGKKALMAYENLLLTGMLPEEAMANLHTNGRRKNEVQQFNFKIAVIAHPYIIYDPYISMNLLNNLHNMGAQTFTADQLKASLIDEKSKILSKKLFWTLSKRMLAATYYYASHKDIDGIIHVSSFACGLDSMTSELIDRKIRNKSEIPYLNIVIDEQTGEAGVITRLEAFLDMVYRKKMARRAK